MIDEKAKIAARNKLTMFLEGKRLRKTPERYAILDKVFSCNSHFDIMTLYKKMEEMLLLYKMMDVCSRFLWRILSLIQESQKYSEDMNTFNSGKNMKEHTHGN